MWGTQRCDQVIRLIDYLGRDGDNQPETAIGVSAATLSAGYLLQALPGLVSCSSRLLRVPPPGHVQPDICASASPR